MQWEHSMVPSIEDVRTERQFKALTGMSRTEFDQFLPSFTEAYEEHRQEAYEAQEAARQRKPGGGQKGKLIEMSQKLFFILYYWKVYPCYDVLGFQFDMDGSKAYTNVQALWPVLKRALAKCEVLPKREFANIEELREAFSQVSDLFIVTSQ